MAPVPSVTPIQAATSGFSHYTATRGGTATGTDLRTDCTGTIRRLSALRWWELVLYPGDFDNFATGEQNS